MSAIGPKQTWAIALHMSAFRGKADIPFCSASGRFWPIGGQGDYPTFAQKLLESADN
jgi:hypothetical protein